jgi:hypothetical protein
MPLTDTVIKNAKPRIINSETTFNRITDEKGMYLFVDKKGHKYFRLDYRLSGKRKCVSLGVYPETTLKEAREKRDEARKLIQKGIDPVEAKKNHKLQGVLTLF